MESASIENNQLLETLHQRLVQAHAAVVNLPPPQALKDRAAGAVDVGPAMHAAELFGLAAAALADAAPALPAVPGGRNFTSRLKVDLQDLRKWTPILCHRLALVALWPKKNPDSEELRTLARRQAVLLARVAEAAEVLSAAITPRAAPSPAHGQAQGPDV